jgi:hypothetical protein
VVGTESSSEVNHPLTPSLSRRGVTRSIFMQSGEPKDHEICAQNDSMAGKSQEKNSFFA